MTTRYVLARLRAEYGRLGPAERKVADYFLDQSERDGVLSISDVAIRAGVSEATIVRFSKRLGYSGFLDFKRAFLNERLQTREDLVPYYEKLADSDDPSTVLHKVFSSMQESLRGSLEQLDPASFDQAARWMAESDMVEFYAHGGSGCIVQSAVFTYQRLGIRCTAYVVPLQQLSAAELALPTDLVVGVSHTGTTECVVQAVRRARDRGVRTIGLTNTPGSPLAQAAQVVLLTADSSRRLISDVGMSRVAQVAVLDALGVAVFQLLRQRRNAAP
ncbi:MAG: MurR/RpiR family transcriptional regulator [Armatimonadota bacterium]|nr:MurR/RpiR family transcriptional regulator [Armatimonadota bacterium]